MKSLDELINGPFDMAEAIRFLAEEVKRMNETQGTRLVQDGALGAPLTEKSSARSKVSKAADTA